MIMALASGCAILPREGPLSGEIENQSEQSEYLVVDVDASIVSGLSAYSSIGLERSFSSSSHYSPISTIGPGDVLSISVFEADKGGLFSGPEGNGKSFSHVVVDRRGYISLPYVGTININGKTPFQVQDIVVKKLEGKAIQPQAMVNIATNQNNVVTVSGDVSKPGIYPLSSNGMRLLDVVAMSGGTRYPARETFVTLQRGNNQGTQLIKTIIDQPRENVFIRTGDRIFVSHDPKRYTVLGAVKKPSIYKFEAEKVSALEAVAAAGGLLDMRADATGLFVFRYEDPKLLEKLGIEYNQIISGHVPTIYRINMKHAKSYFYAQSFNLRDKDSLYVSNAQSVQISKMLTLVRDAAYAANYGSSTYVRFED